MLSTLSPPADTRLSGEARGLCAQGEIGPRRRTGAIATG